ncbi:hypothetical protein WMY93_012621 [Mugilogobius chulae]|uniref:Uncharacterized protein n=1 Tax=Mugilogobius chulae TaxID=88201 RepID=A0AAW0NX42_9GOBI
MVLTTDLVLTLQHCSLYELTEKAKQSSLVSLFKHTSVSVSVQGPDQKRLYSNLMKSYNVLERPVVNDSETLIVEFGITLMQIMDVDEKNQVLTTNIWLHLFYTELYTSENPCNFTQINSFLDDLTFPTVSPEILSTLDVNISIIESRRQSNRIFKSTCRIDVRWFPFDEQRCELKFGSWSYDGWAIDLKMLEADISGYTSNGEWDLVAYPDITYTVVMRRRTLYYGLNLLLPCILISTLALLVFLLPADSGEKISLAQYFATTMVIVGLSVIATVLVLQYHHHDPNGSKMPKWTRVFLLNWCAWFLRMKRPGEDKVRSACPNKGMRSSLSSIETQPQNSTSNMLYVSVRGLDSNPHSTAATSPDSGVMCGRLLRTGEEEQLMPPSHIYPVGSVEPEMSKILEEVRYIAKRFRDQDQEETVGNEWKFAACVIDRLCLMAFSIFTILCTIGILMSAPNFVDAISKDVLSN